MSTFVNERPAIAATAICLARSGVEIGSIYPGRLYVGEVPDGDQGRVYVLELGFRVLQYAAFPCAPFRERIS